MRLENQTALITGSSGGIGEEFARQLALRGANLILVARRADKLDQLRTELLERSPALKIDVVTADLSIPGSAADLAVKVEALGRRVDILVNNAGVGLHGDFVSQDRAANAAQIQLNCVTLVELTALYLPAMTRAGRGMVINVASTAAFQPTPGMAVYGATKAFVLSFTEAIWQETKSTAVRVFALCPGATETEFFARTGEEFLTSGRQTSEQVVAVAMAAIDKSTPTVISGLRNTLLANGYRIAPRRMMLKVTQKIMKAE
ncbi:MAG: SDR family oxidoreductase [Mycobacterium sp.]|nr:SDR family oxidoreductase [Mycobacterium sp.]